MKILHTFILLYKSVQYNLYFCPRNPYTIHGILNESNPSESSHEKSMEELYDNEWS